MNRLISAVSAALFLSLTAIAAPPAVGVDSPASAAANRVALESAIGRADLPTGTIYTDAPVTLTSRNNGLSLRGESAIRSTQTLGGQLARSALLLKSASISSRGDETPASRGAVLPPGQVGWHFQGNDGQVVGGTVDRILPGQQIPTTLEFIRAFRAVPFVATGLTEFSVPAGHSLTIGEDVFASDGPAVNEVLTEFRRVVAVGKQSVTLDRPLYRPYRQGALVRGPFPARQTFRGLTFAGQLGTVLGFQAVDLQFSDCKVNKPPDFPATDPNNRFSLIGCGRVDIRRCDFGAIDGVGLSNGHDIRLIDCKARAIIGEQNQISVTVERCSLGWLDAWQRCHEWVIRDSEFSGGPNFALAIYDDWLVENVRASGPVVVYGQNARVTNLRTNGSVVVRSDAPAKHPRSATNVTLTDIEAESIDLYPGTSGRLYRCSGAINADAATRANWTLNGKPLP